MDQLNWVTYEILFEQELEKRRREAKGMRTELPNLPSRRSPLREALAGLLVRVGLLLDPAAGERLRAPDLSRVATEARPQA